MRWQRVTDKNRLAAASSIKTINLMNHSAWVKLRRPLRRGRQRVEGSIAAAGRALERKPQAPFIIAAAAVEPRPRRNLIPRFVGVEHDRDALAHGDYGSVSGEPTKHSMLALNTELIYTFLAGDQQPILHVRHNTANPFQHVHFLVRIGGGVVGMNFLALNVDEVKELEGSIPDWAVPVNTSAVECHRHLCTADRW